MYATSHAARWTQEYDQDYTQRLTSALLCLTLRNNSNSN